LFFNLLDQRFYFGIGLWILFYLSFNIFSYFWLLQNLLIHYHWFINDTDLIESFLVRVKQDFIN